MAEPVKIAIVFERGVFRNCLTAGVPVEFVVVEYEPSPDEVAQSESPVVEMARPDGTVAQAFVWDGNATRDGRYVTAALAMAESLAGGDRSPTPSMESDPPSAETEGRR